MQLNLIVRGGWSADPKTKLGLSSFTAALQDEGTATRSALQISDEAERLGAQIDAGSFLDSATVSLNALKSRLEPSIALWADVVLNPSFPEAEIERKRQQTLGRIFFEKGDPGRSRRASCQFCFTATATLTPNRSPVPARPNRSRLSRATTSSITTAPGSSQTTPRSS